MLTGLPDDKLPEALNHATLQLSFGSPVHLAALQRAIKPLIRTAAGGYAPAPLPLSVQHCGAGERAIIAGGVPRFGRPEGAQAQVRHIVLILVSSTGNRLSLFWLVKIM